MNHFLIRLHIDGDANKPQTQGVYRVESSDPGMAIAKMLGERGWEDWCIDHQGNNVFTVQASAEAGEYSAIYDVQKVAN